MSKLKNYFRLLGEKDFLVLISTLLLGQIASAFLVLALITSVFTKTGSNFGVSGVILSLSSPALVVMIISGIFSDLFDRKKIIIYANLFITLVVFVLLAFFHNVFASILLSFLYFAGNSFFLPAISAASAQIVKKEELSFANSLFFFSLAGGQIFGFFIAAVVQFVFGNYMLIVVCAVLLTAAAILPMFLPPLPPRKKNIVSFALAVFDIFRAFTFIFKSRTIWFYFVILASSQGIVAFAATLTPGFFDRILGIPAEKSPLLIFPLAALGLVGGTMFTHRPKINESYWVMVGLGGLGAAAAVVGILYKFNFDSWVNVLIVVIFLLLEPFFMITIMIAARTVLQRRVPHNYQGTVFGANFVLAALFATIMSPFAATIVTLFGYLNVLTYLGFMVFVIAVVISFMRAKWRF